MALDPRHVHNTLDVAPLVPIVHLKAQSGDNSEVLLAKIANVLNNSRQLSGQIYDQAGFPAAVLKDWEEVAPNEAYEELVEAPPAGKRIRLLGFMALCDNDATKFTLYSKVGAEAAVQAGPVLPNAANGGEVFPYCQHGWLPDLPAGAALGCSTTNNEVTSVIFIYALVPNYLTDENGLVVTDENGVPLYAPV